MKTTNYGKNLFHTGVYIEEKNAFTNSVVAVPTAVPCFIGFTEKATRNHEPLTNQLVRIASFDEFNRYFGGAPKIKYDVAFKDNILGNITPYAATQFYLYYSLKLYFNNGGGDCYIFSVGSYGPKKLEADMVIKAEKHLKKEPEPTIIVIPDGHTMESASDYYGLWKSITEHCKSMINRFAILDIHGGGKPENLAEPSDIAKLHKEFKNGVQGELAYAAAYWALGSASVVQPSELDFLNIKNLSDVVAGELKLQIAEMYPQVKEKNEKGEDEYRDDPRAIKIKELITEIVGISDRAAKADAAKTVANVARAAADKSKTEVDEAAKADAAKIKADAAETDAGAAKIEADAAKTKADAAKAKTDAAKAKADAAKTKADADLARDDTDEDAKTAVTKAKTESDKANAEADTANAEADRATETAAEAKIRADKATKEATAATAEAEITDLAKASAAKTVADTAKANSDNDLSEANKAKADKSEINRKHNALWQTSPLYKSIMMRLRDVANILPPSGAMAGVYKTVDSSIGTHKAPANVGFSSVVKPMVNINDHEQESLNIPIDGKAINAIRSFPGKGILVWGARTMDGNSQDWRYISVRRTVSMIELSIKYAAEAFVFEPNISSTWSNMKAMITNFLTNMWYAGALAGASPDASFSVEVGLGNTMTAVDILDGYMRISVKIAVTRPAEFIVITFEQQMQTS